MQIVSLTMYVEVFQFVKFVSKTNIFAKIQFFYKNPNFYTYFPYLCTATLQGRVKFPIGGKVREPSWARTVEITVPTVMQSPTGLLTVWMEEEARRQACVPWIVCRKVTHSRFIL